MIFWPEELFDAWNWSALREAAGNAGWIFGTLCYIALVYFNRTKKDDRLSAWVFLVMPVMISYEFVLRFAIPWNLIYMIITIVVSWYLFCSKKGRGEWDEKERKGIICSHKDIYEKQQEDLQKLSPEEQKLWYENYLKTAPPRPTLLPIILINLFAYMLAEGIKLAYYFSL